MNVVASLKRKLGPLPAWAWLGIFAAAVYLYRRLHTSATASATAGAGADVGQLGYGLPAFDSGAGGGGGAADGLPSPQRFADPSLSGSSPTFFDPLSGGVSTDPATGIGSFIGYGPDGQPVYQTRTGPSFVGDTNVGTGLTTPVRPKSSTGQKKTHTKHPPSNQKLAAAPQLVSEHGRGQVTVPAAVARATARTRAASAAAVTAPARSTASATVDAGARTAVQTVAQSAAISHQEATAKQAAAVAQGYHTAGF